MKRILLAAALLCATTVAMPASADVIFDNGSYEASSIWDSDVDGFAIYSNSFVLNEGASTVTDIHWWGTYFDPNNIIGGGTPQAFDVFTIVFYADDGGVPGSAIATYDVGDVGRTDTGDNFALSDVYAYSADISPLALTAGTTYWISIYNDTTGDADDWAWMRTDSGTGSGAYSQNVGQSWTANGNINVAFTLTNDGVVPEPASILLMGFGFAGVAWRARKKRS